MENSKENNLNSLPFDSFQEEEIKRVWKKSYTWVLLVNVVYIIIFYLLMKFL